MTATIHHFPKQHARSKEIIYPSRTRWTPSREKIEAVYEDPRSLDTIVQDWGGLSIATLRRIKEGETYVNITCHGVEKRRHNPDRLKGAALSQHRERSLVELINYAIEYYPFIPHKHADFTARFMARHFNHRDNNPSSHVTKFKEVVIPAIADQYVEYEGGDTGHLDMFISHFDDDEPLTVRHCVHLIEQLIPSWPDNAYRSIMFTVLCGLRIGRHPTPKQWRSVCISLSRLCREEEACQKFADCFDRWAEQLAKQCG